jgi:hypothetical protein
MKFSVEKSKPGLKIQGGVMDKGVAEPGKRPREIMLNFKAPEGIGKAERLKDREREAGKYVMTNIFGEGRDVTRK